MNKIQKILSRIERSIIYKLDGVNTRLYMRKYNAWLKKNGVDIHGKTKYINHTAFLDGTDYSRIHLGNNLVISLGCVLLIHDFSIEAGFCAIRENTTADEAYILDDIRIGNDCFIGANCTILAGTELGDNCIVGAGSVLCGKKYPNNSVIVGNPGKVICNTTDWARRKKEENKYLVGYFN